jgi:hypothetical protein
MSKYLYYIQCSCTSWITPLNQKRLTNKQACLCHPLIVAEFVIPVKKGKWTSQMHSESFSGVSITVLTSNYFSHFSQIAAVSIIFKSTSYIRESLRNRRPYDRLTTASKASSLDSKSSYSSCNFQHLLVTLRSPSSCLRLLLRLSVPSIFPSKCVFRRQSLHLNFRLCISSFISSSVSYQYTYLHCFTHYTTSTIL